MAGVPLLKVDREGTIVAENEAAVDLLGSCLGKSCHAAVAAQKDGALHCHGGCATELAGTGTTADVDGADIASRKASLVCSAMGDELVVAIVPEHTEVPKHPLTPREREIVELIAEGLTNARIAKRLGIAASTVRTHIERLLEKLHARSRAEAVSRAVTTGQLSLTD